MNPDSKINRYSKEGHLHCEAILDTDVLTDFKATVEAYFDLDRDKKVEIEPSDICDFLPAAKDLMANPKLRVKAQELLGCDQVKVWHDQLIIRPPGIGRESRWHQDLAYWPLDEPSVITCWIPLHDVSATTGCLRVMPGSHTWGNRPSIVPKSLQEMIELGDALQQGHPGHPKELPMQCGGCDFHHSLLFHGATANRSDSYRIAYKILYLRDDSEFALDVFSRASGVQPTN